MANIIRIAEKMALSMNMQYKSHIVINRTKFFKAENVPIKMYVVRDAYHIDGKFCDKELFRSSSAVYTCMFMRDLLYSMRGDSIIDDPNEGWQNTKRRRNVEEMISYMVKTYGAHELQNGNNRPAG